MSGPKLSAAELERLRQEELERQRLETLRQLQEAQTAYRQACTALQNIRDASSQMFLQTSPTYRAGLQTQFDSLMESMRAQPDLTSKDPADYHNAAERINRMSQQLASGMDKLIGKAVSRSQADSKLNAAGNAYRDFQAAVNDRQGKLKVLRLDFSCKYDLKVLTDQLTALRQHYDMLAGRTDMPDVSRFAEKAAAALAKHLRDPQLAQQIDQMRSYMQQLINEEQELIRQWNAKAALYDAYTAIAVMTDTVPKPPSGFSDQKALQKEIDRLRQIFRKKDEMDYIADQINAVMADMGYTFVSSRVLTRDGHVETDLSLYQADDRTGVSIYTDETGAVMMHMTVLGDDTDITDADRDFSYQRQIDFCAAHSDLVDALAARGVYLKQQNYKLPDRKYTKKVKISTGDSAVQSGDQVAAATQRIDRRRRRRAGNKKMRVL